MMPERAIALLQKEQAIKDVLLEGIITPASAEHFRYAIHFENCTIQNFDGNLTQFTKPVRFIGCHFQHCTFAFAYFLQGLTIERCTFEQPLDLQAGGHNQPGYPVIIRDNSFAGFVNFFDCWYQGEVVVCGNTFAQGTNIASKRQLITFDTQPVVENNQGSVNLESEEAVI